MGGFLQDLRYVGRMFRKNAGFTAITILTLAVGIAANSAIFSLVNGILLRPLPYQEPERLAMLWTDDPQHDVREEGTSYPNFLDWQKQTEAFDDLAVCTRGWSFTLVAGDDTERVAGEYVSSNLFTVLGTKPILGRVFSAEEEQNSEPVALISFQLWQRRYGSDPNVIGKIVETNGDGPAKLRIIGVTSSGFYFPTKTTHIWTPATLMPTWQRDRSRRFTDYFRVIGRLKAGETFERAQAELTSIGQRLAETYPIPPTEDFAGFAVNVVPMLDQFTGKNLQLALWMLLGAVAFVLLISCANVANLLLAKGAAREREFTIRSALGASRTRLIRQLMTESIVLSLAAGALGFGLALVSVRLLVAFAPAGIPRIDEVSMNAEVLVFTILVSVLTGILFGLAPAWRLSRTEFGSSLTEGGRGSSSGLRLRQVRGLLIAIECALAVVLLIGAGLLMKSFAQLRSVEPGFETSKMVLARIALPSRSQFLARASLPTDPNQLRAQEESGQLNRQAVDSLLQNQRNTVYTQVVDRLSALPGVESVGSIGDFFVDRNPDWEVTIEGRPKDRESKEPNPLTRDIVSPDFFQTIGVPLKSGRFFTDQEGREQARTTQSNGITKTFFPTLINETMAHRFFHDENPVGKRFFTGGPSRVLFFEVVGVVGDMHRQGLEKPTISEFYIPGFIDEVDFVIRSSVDSGTIAGMVRDAIKTVDKSLIVTNVSTMDQAMQQYAAQRRFQTFLLTIFACVALGLSAIGIYSVMHYSVAGRIREIGIRIALGAQRRDVVRLIVTQGMKIALVGLALGLLAGVWMTSLMSHLLFRTSATDPMTFLWVACVLAFTGSAACFLPARKAASVDPMVALRIE